MKYILFIYLTIYTLYANNYIDTYRKYGLKGVEKLINKTLIQKSYWDNYIKNIDVSNGYFESINYLLKCSKEMKVINIIDIKQHKNKLIFTSNVITGENNGDKHNEGDLKTPIGIYKLTKKLINLDPFYGPMALVTSYPNRFDKLLGKTGSGIWIHGKPKNNIRKPFTKGCIALDNNNLQKLNSTIDLKNSVLMIQEDKNIIATKDQIANILSQLFLWKQYWTNNNIKNYLSFYSKEFKKSNGMNYIQFSQYKKRIFSKNEEKSITFTKINIIPYPNNLNKNIFEITFYEKYKSPSFKFYGKKILYIELKNNTMKILNEG